jgi:hypothetical protein
MKRTNHLCFRCQLNDNLIRFIKLS